MTAAATRHRPERSAAALALALVLSGCAAAPLERGETLGSYDGLVQSDGLVTKSQLRVDKDAVLAARTVKLVPTEFAPQAEVAGVTEEQRELVENAVDRALCAGLSERFVVVMANEEADLTVRALITQMTATDGGIVAATKAVSVAKMVLLPGVPVPTPRIPIGLGSLSVEAEATTPAGRQDAAMLWARGANALSGSARVSSSGDAYELAAAFGDDFSKLVATGESPFGKLSGPPSPERIALLAGGKPKYPACEAFGRELGVAGFVGGAIGVPPEWNDPGAANGDAPTAAAAGPVPAR